MPQFPSPFSASGIWSLKKHKRAEQGDNWPYGPTYDPQFNYVTALLSNSSTDASRNNTFLDSSTNAFTITRNGNATQGSFNPYGPNWSIFCGGGTGDYLAVPDNGALDFGTGDFTIELWFNPSRIQDSTILAGWTTSGVVNGWSVGFGSGSVGMTSANNDVYITTSVSATITAGTWYHLAVVRSGGSFRAFLNGVGGTPVTNNQTIDTQSAGMYIGRSTYNPNPAAYQGYVSNVRVIKGTALYSSNFNPSTAPLTVISGTSLLTCKDNRFVDNSSNNFSLSPNGTVSVERFNPFGLTEPYAPSTSGGSGYFDGSGDFLTWTGTSAGAGAFSYEFWIYSTNGFGTMRAPLGVIATSGYNSALDIRMSGSTINVSQYNVANNNFTVPTLQANTWYHVVVCRNASNQTTVFVNGVRSSTGAITLSTNFSGLTSAIGRLDPSNGGDVTGYIGGVRLITGSTPYDPTQTTIAIPTTPPTAITGTQFLCNFTNGNIFNAATQSNFETIGDTQTNTSVTKYTVSTYFDGNGDCLSMPLNEAVQFRNSNFTVEMWVHPLTTNHQSACLFVQEHIGASNTPISLAIWLNNGSFESVGNRIGFGVYNGSAGNGTWTINAQNLSTISINTWTHVALSRVGDVFTLYINGNPVGGATSSTSCSLGSTQYFIGRRWDLTGSFPYFNGYISEFRITRGYARYWSPFTPPTAPLPVSFGQEALPTSDPLYDYVALHLAGNGTNGVQNNTFVDSSTNAFAITRNGNTSQGTFSPYGTTWSNYFDGSGDYLSIPAGQAWNFGTGPFTIEAWLCPDGDEDNAYGIFNVTGNTANEWALGVGAGLGNWGLYFYWGDHGRNQTERFTNIYPQRGVWSHVAVTRDANSTWRFFINGVALATSTYQEGGATWSDTRNLNNVTNAVGIGYDFKGHISNLRVVKGAAVYTSNFTPSNAPLTAITNTSLLTCQSNRFVDNSGSNLTITRNGDVSVQRFSPFNPPAAYSAATIGGSGYFDGSGDWLNISSAPPASIRAWAANDFTVEAWVYPTSFSGWSYNDGQTHSTLVGNRSATTTGDYWSFGPCADGVVRLYYYNGAPITVSSGLSIPLNQWSHVAFTKTSSGIRFFVNGVASGFTAISGTPITGSDLAFTVGVANNTNLTGYVGDLRIVNGAAVYSGATYTVPTAPLTAITNTSLLLNFTNSGIIDNAMINDLETMGNAQISTTQSKFGGASMYFDGSGDSLATPSSSLFSFDGDVTIECWIYANALTGVANSICGSHSGLNDGKTMFYVYNNGRLGIGRVGVNEITSAAGTITTGVWYHVAAVKYGSVTTLYVNGARVASGTTGVWSTGASNFYVSYVHPSNGNTWNGYIDDLRVTRGVARYVQSFPAPTRAHLTA